MGCEIERKFLVHRNAWTPPDNGIHYCQGYLCHDMDATVRVRIAGEHGYLTIKSRPVGIVRSEFEYAIPLTDAREMLDHLCGESLIDKTRYIVDYGGRRWEVDIFHGRNEGLITAEVELDDENDVVTIPPWIDHEVSDDPRYSNSELSRNPYCDWSSGK